jgi:hypothetical protein
LVTTKKVVSFPLADITFVSSYKNFSPFSFINRLLQSEVGSHFTFVFLALEGASSVAVCFSSVAVCFFFLGSKALAAFYFSLLKSCACVFMVAKPASIKKINTFFIIYLFKK